MKVLFVKEKNASSRPKCLRKIYNYRPNSHHWYDRGTYGENNAKIRPKIALQALLLCYNANDTITYYHAASATTHAAGRNRQKGANAVNQNHSAEYKQL